MMTSAGGATHPRQLSWSEPPETPPGLPSSPGIAVALRQAMTPEFKAYQQQVVANCKALSTALMELGYDIVTGEDRSWLWDGADACVAKGLSQATRAARARMQQAGLCHCNSSGKPQNYFEAAPLPKDRPPSIPKTRGRSQLNPKPFLLKCRAGAAFTLIPRPPLNPSLCRGLRQPPDSPGPAQQRHGWRPG